MEISKDFVGGNISVESIENISDNDVCVHLKNEIRDTVGDWFYWAFKVVGANGKTVKFIFDEPDRVGYFGAAVSLDFKNWNWVDNADGESFTYTFGESETEVYFAHHMLYHPNRFEKLADKLGLEIKTLCKSRKGRDIPFVEFGKGDKSIVLTSRHHACESTGSYVLEGVLEELVNDMTILDEYKIFCVPFVDYDGVVDGDQGKNRFSGDHNRGYFNESMYESVNSIKRFFNKNSVCFAFDFHSPWHKTGMNDTVFIVHKTIDKDRVERLETFGTIFEKCVENNKNSFKYYTNNDIEYGLEWNKISDTPVSFSAFSWLQKEMDLTFTLETAYFGSSDGANKVSDVGLVELGKSFAKALNKYINR